MEYMENYLKTIREAEDKFLLPGICKKFLLECKEKLFLEDARLLESMLQWMISEKRISSKSPCSMDAQDFSEISRIDVASYLRHIIYNKDRTKFERTMKVVEFLWEYLEQTGICRDVVNRNADFDVLFSNAFIGNRTAFQENIRVATKDFLKSLRFGEEDIFSLYFRPEESDSFCEMLDADYEHFDGLRRKVEISKRDIIRCETELKMLNSMIKECVSYADSLQNLVNKKKRAFHELSVGDTVYVRKKGSDVDIIPTKVISVNPKRDDVQVLYGKYHYNSTHYPEYIWTCSGIGSFETAGITGFFEHGRLDFYINLYNMPVK